MRQDFLFPSGIAELKNAVITPHMHTSKIQLYAGL